NPCLGPEDRVYAVEPIAAGMLVGLVDGQKPQRRPSRLHGAPMRLGLPLAGRAMLDARPGNRVDLAPVLEEEPPRDLPGDALVWTRWASGDVESHIWRMRFY